MSQRSRDSDNRTSSRRSRRSSPSDLPIDQPGGSSPVAAKFVEHVERKIVPWAEEGMKRVVVAHKQWREAVLPPNVSLSHKKLTSRRTGASGPRLYGNASGPYEKWVDEDQEVIRIPMLVCVLSGQTDFRVGNYVLHCPEGTFIFLPPGVPHSSGHRSHLEGENRINGSCDLFWFTPHGRRVQCWICSSRGEAHDVLLGNENVLLFSDKLIALFEIMQEEAANGGPEHERIFGGAMHLFALSLYRELRSGRFLRLDFRTGEEPPTPQNFDPVLRAQEYVKSNLARPLSIDAVAGIVHLSRSHFTQRFRQQTGQTFIEYVNDCRLEQAKIFLSDTDWSVAAISEFVGLRSVQHFHALFRRMTGMTPVEYRRQNKHEGQQELAIPEEQAQEREDEK